MLGLSKLKAQDIQTEKQEVVRLETEDRDTQTDQKEDITAAENRAHCGFFNLQFADRLMTCMFQGVHEAITLSDVIFVDMFVRANWTSSVILYEDSEKIKKSSLYVSRIFVAVVVKVLF